jgi:hypothetical protein
MVTRDYSRQSRIAATILNGEVAPLYCLQYDEKSNTPSISNLDQPFSFLVGSLADYLLNVGLRILSSITATCDGVKTMAVKLYLNVNL